MSNETVLMLQKYSSHNLNNCSSTIEIFLMSIFVLIACLFISNTTICCLTSKLLYKIVKDSQKDICDDISYTTLSETDTKIEFNSEFISNPECVDMIEIETK